ncbi:MAG: OsmC family protein [Gemmatimonadota bacterium]
MNNTRSARIRWTGRGVVFEGRSGDAPPILLDSDSMEGPSPTEALLMSIGACMGVDVRMILEKGRVPVDGLEIVLEGERAPEAPRRFVSLRLEIRVEGPGPDDLAKLERAARLSHEKYCSVFHTLRPDLDVEVTTVRV